MNAERAKKFKETPLGSASGVNEVTQRRMQGGQVSTRSTKLDLVDLGVETF